MNVNLLISKIAAPYAQAIFIYSNEHKNFYRISRDFQNLAASISGYHELTAYLRNPVVMASQKQEVLNKLLKPKLSYEAFECITLLVDRNRINIFEEILQEYMKLVAESAGILTVKVETAVKFKGRQEARLMERLKTLTNLNNVKLDINVDPTLIGGFLIKTESKIIDFTVKNKLQQLSKHLDSALEI